MYDALAYLICIWTGVFIGWGANALFSANGRTPSEDNEPYGM